MALARGSDWLYKRGASLRESEKTVGERWEFLMPHHSALAVANEFIKLAMRDGYPLTQMHIQKLVYLAHGWNLAVNGKELVEDEIEAWDFGPVIRKLHDALAIFGAKKIGRLLRWNDDVPSSAERFGPAIGEFAEKEIDVIHEVWKNYKGFEAFKLSALTHAPGGPWSKTYEKGKSKVISNNIIWNNFADLAAAA
jgi:uncharacterized phage-associated protein